MSRRFLFNFLITVAVFAAVSCGTNPTTTEMPKNDTTVALSLLLNEDFLSRHMPGFGGLQKPGPFGDTIIFRIDSVVERYLPENLNGFHFKFLTKDQICEQAITLHRDKTYFPDFFQLNRFQKRGDTYDIALQVTCVMPLLAYNGRRLSEHFSYKFDDCMFGMLCGGGIGVTVFREHDTLKIIKENSWSD